MKLIINIQQKVVSGKDYYRSQLTKAVYQLQNFEVYEFARMIKVKKEHGEWLTPNTDAMAKCMQIIQDAEIDNIDIINLFEDIIKKRLVEIKTEAQYFLKLLN